MTTISTSTARSSTTTTPSRTPPAQPTDEATKEGLRLAREAGDAYIQMVDYFLKNVAQSGGRQEAGEYVVGFSVESAEPLYHVAGGELHLAEPAAGDNAHLEVVVADGADRRFVPELRINVTLLDSQGSECGTFHLPFLWHPTMYHYGRDVHVPAEGDYTARVYIDVPEFERHDKTNGKRYTEAVVAEFRGIHIRPGSK